MAAPPGSHGQIDLGEVRVGGRGIAEQVLTFRVGLDERPTAHLPDERIGERFVKEPPRAGAAGAEPAVHACPDQPGRAQFDAEVAPLVDLDHVEAEQCPRPRQVLLGEGGVRDSEPLVELRPQIQLERPVVAGGDNDVNLVLGDRNRIHVGFGDERQGPQDAPGLLDEEWVEAVSLPEEQFVADQARPGAAVDAVRDPVRELGDPAVGARRVRGRRVDGAVVDEDPADDRTLARARSDRVAGFLCRRAARARRPQGREAGGKRAPQNDCVHDVIACPARSGGDAEGAECILNMT